MMLFGNKDANKFVKVDNLYFLNKASEMEIVT